MYNARLDIGMLFFSTKATIALKFIKKVHYLLISLFRMKNK